MTNQSMHVDPEFTTFTYGDPTSPKAGLRHLEEGDMLIFYCGLIKRDFWPEPALYIIGYFEVQTAGYARDYTDDELNALFAENFHVRHKNVSHLIFAQREHDSIFLRNKRRFLIV